MDNELKIKITADISSLQSGLADAQAQVKAATANMADAQRTLGDATVASLQQATDAVAAYSAGIEDAKANLDALTAAAQEASGALSLPGGSTEAGTAPAVGATEAAATRAPAAAVQAEQEAIPPVLIAPAPAEEEAAASPALSETVAAETLTARAATEPRAEEPAGPDLETIAAAKELAAKESAETEKAAIEPASVKVTTDLSGLKAGLADAQEQVRVASANMAEAQLAFGKAAAQGSDQAKAALAEYSAELANAKAQLDSLAESAARAKVAPVRRQEAQPDYASWRDAAAGQSASTAQQAAAATEATAAEEGEAAALAQVAAADDAASASAATLTSATETSRGAAEQLAASSASATQAIGGQTSATSRQATAVMEEAAANTAAATSNQEFAASSDVLTRSQLEAIAAADAEEASSTRRIAALEEYGRVAGVGAESQKLLTWAFDEARAAGANLTEALETAVGAYNQITDAAAKASVAELEQAAGAKEAAAANAGNVSEMTAASTAARLATGSMMGAARGAAAFATTTLGLGPILQAAFPVIGAIALISILYEAGNALYSVYEKATQAGEEIDRAFGAANEKIEASTDAIELENSKLQDQIDKLEGHPSNGLQTALLEALDAADKLQASLEGDTRALAALLKQHEVGYLGGIISGVAPTVKTDKTVTQVTQTVEDKGRDALTGYREKLNAAGPDEKKREEATKAYYDEINSITAEGTAKLKPILDHYYELQRENNEKIATLHKAGLPAIPFTATADIDYSPNVNAAKSALEQLSDIQAKMKAMAETLPLEQKKGKLEQQKGDASAANKAAEDHLRQLEATFAIQEQQYGVSANQTEAYWDQYLNTFKQGSTEFKTVIDKVIRAQEEMGKRKPPTHIETELKKEVTEARKDADELQRIYDTIATAQRKLVTEEITKPAGAQAEQAHQQNAGGIETQETKVEGNQALGLIEPLQALEQLRALHQQAIAEDERYITQEIAIYAQEPAKVQELEKQLAAVHQKGLQEQLRDTTKILQEEQQAWKKAYDVMTNDLNEALNKMITSTQKPAQIFAQMFNQILAQLATFVEKWIEQKVEMWIKDQAAQAVGQAASKTLSLGQIEQAAATAAANTYASVSAVPIIGPVLAPPAAAVAYAAVLAFEAFEAGGIVAGASGMPVPIMAHAGERVLSAPQTQNFERMVNQPAGGAGNTFNLNYHGQVNAFDRSGMRSTLNAHAEDILSIVKQGWNTGRLS